MKTLRAGLSALTVAAIWVACSSDNSPPPDTHGPQQTPCDTEEDCVAPSNSRCGKRSCVNAVCELEIYLQSRSNFRGDCQVDMCTSTGFAVPRPDLNDVEDDGNPCTNDSCYEAPDGTYSRHVDLEAGPAPTGSGFCDERGHLVQCLKAEDCDDMSLTCSGDKACVPLACTNHVRDESIGESFTDCGGPCDTCAIGKPCNIGADCISGICGDDKICAVPTCQDGVKNGIETGVDCGGQSCGPCPDGSGCISGNDCETRSCFAGKCQPRTCDDDLRNGDEEDIDCGAECPPCQY